MVNAMVTFEGLNFKQLKMKSISISCDGNNAFSRCKN